MERINGDTEMTSGDEGIESHMHLGGGPADDRQTHGRTGRIPEFRERAGELLAKRSDIVSTIKANPIVSVGAAFATGFVIAAVTGSRSHHWAISRARKQVRRFLLGVATATIAHEVRSLIEHEDLDELNEAFDEEDLEQPGPGGAAHEDDLDPFDESPF